MVSQDGYLVGDVADLAADGRRFVEVDGRDVVVLWVDERAHAFENRCLHMGGPVGEGMVIGKVKAVLDADKRLVGECFSDRMQIVCPWHGWAYDVETGTCAGDDRLALTKFQTSIRDGQVYVHV